MTEEEKVYKVLDELEINYTCHEHPPLYTVEDAKKFDIDIPGAHCKNLFLKNKKGKKHYLVILEDSKRLSFNDLSGVLNGEKLSFASERRLDKYLNLKPGSVSVFGLINDINNEVKVVIDSELKNFEKINFHPNVNTKTLTINFGDFKSFLNWCGNDFFYCDI
ncbi:MAG: prolyl-tRNA synthetase associated domain-containing protein [Firmicutes bacterium]|nr:prolyl-tRNA synthetase associated domain-containing protein [Bacillota bacterium]